MIDRIRAVVAVFCGAFLLNPNVNAQNCNEPVILEEFFRLNDLNAWVSGIIGKPYRLQIVDASVSGRFLLLTGKEVVLNPAPPPGQPAQEEKWIINRVDMGSNQLLDHGDDIKVIGEFKTKNQPKAKISSDGWIAMVVDLPRSTPVSVPNFPNIEVPDPQGLVTCHESNCSGTIQLPHIEFGVGPHPSQFPNPTPGVTPKFALDGEITSFIWEEPENNPPSLPWLPSFTGGHPLLRSNATLLVSYVQFPNPYPQGGYPWNPSPPPGATPSPIEHSRIMRIEPWPGGQKFNLHTINTTDTRLMLSASILGRFQRYGFEIQTYIKPPGMLPILDSKNYSKLELDIVSQIGGQPNPNYHQFGVEPLGFWNQLGSVNTTSWGRIVGMASFSTLFGSVPPSGSIETIAVGAIQKPNSSPTSSIRNVVYRRSTDGGTFSASDIPITDPNENYTIGHVALLKHPTSNDRILIAADTYHIATQLKQIQTFVFQKGTSQGGAGTLQPGPITMAQRFRLHDASGNYLIGATELSDQSTTQGNGHGGPTLLHCPF